MQTTFSLAYMSIIGSSFYMWPLLHLTRHRLVLPHKGQVTDTEDLKSYCKMGKTRCTCTVGNNVRYCTNGFSCEENTEARNCRKSMVKGYGTSKKETTDESASWLVLVKVFFLVGKIKLSEWMKMQICNFYFRSTELSIMMCSTRCGSTAVDLQSGSHA